MRERIDITEVESKTKIRAKYLRAIENEEWDLLPGPVYAKSFLRTYGDFLGLDSRMLLDEFKRRYERPSDHELRPIGSIAARDRDRNRQPRQRLPSWVPIGIAVVAVLVILFVVGSLGQSGSTTTTTTHGAVRHRPHHHHTVPVIPTTPAKVTLQLTPTGLVYVCLVNARGVKLINEQTFNVGETIPTATASKLLLTLGNASVQMKVDGKVVPVAPSSTAIRLEITPSAITHIPDTQTPTCP